MPCGRIVLKDSVISWWDNKDCTVGGHLDDKEITESYKYFFLEYARGEGIRDILMKQIKEVMVASARRQILGGKTSDTHAHRDAEAPRRSLRRNGSSRNPVCQTTTSQM
jgi:hypothetical protein